MKSKGFYTRFDDLRHTEEDGIALVSTVILSFVILIIAASLSFSLVSASKLTANSKSEVVTFSSAESGENLALAYLISNSCYSGEPGGDWGKEEIADMGAAVKVFRTGAGVAAPTALDEMTAGCPIHGDEYFGIESTGTDARGKETTVSSIYRWVIRNGGNPEGAIVAGKGLSNISQLGVYNTDGDLLIQEGNFDCNTSSDISGDVVVMNGNAKLSNACNIRGSLYASGDVEISNNAVGVGENVYAKGNFFMTTSATVTGNVYANGNIEINSGAKVNGSIYGAGDGQTKIGTSTIGGNVSTAATVSIQEGAKIQGNVLSEAIDQPNQIYGATIGSIRVNGFFSQLQKTDVEWSITAASREDSSIAPDVNTRQVYLGGNIITYGGGPNAIYGTYTNYNTWPQYMSRWATPDQLLPGFFSWRDWNYNPEEWRTAGYEVAVPPSCDFQSSSAARQAVNSRTTPTVFDLRGCTVNAYGAIFRPKTDITFVVGAGTSNLSQIQVIPQTGIETDFIIMHPDAVEDKAYTCAAPSTINLARAKFAENATAFIYSPCEIKFGGNSELNGQIYAGLASYEAGGITTLDYLKTTPPGFPVLTAESIPAAFDRFATKRAMPIIVSRVES